jgi:hypothetical protein
LKAAGRPTGSIKPKSAEKVEVAVSTCSSKGLGKSAGSIQQEPSDKAPAGLSAGTPKEAGTLATGETPDSFLRSALDVEVAETSLKMFIDAHKHLLTMGALFQCVGSCSINFMKDRQVVGVSVEWVCVTYGL